MNPLPMTGTAALLEQLSPFVPDELIDSLLRLHGRRGRPPAFSSSQLFRVLLLALLTPAHSFNLLLQLLPEHRPWRSFARLRHRHRLPDAKMLHQFRDRLNLTVLRCINQHLLEPLIEQASGFPKTLALMDSTDLPAAAKDKKKRTDVTLHVLQQWVAGASRAGTRATLWATRSIRSACG